MKEKLKKILVPFLLIDAGCVLIYTFLNWLLFIHLKMGPVKEEIRNLWVPIVLPILPIAFWLIPGLDVLKFRPKARNPVFGYCMLAWLGMLAPILVAQSYLETATGRLTRLTKMEDIRGKEPTRYYQVDHYWIDTLHAGSWFTRTVTGKTNSSLDLDFYLVFPVYSDSTEVLQDGPGGVLITPRQPASTTDAAPGNRSLPDSISTTDSSKIVIGYASRPAPIRQPQAWYVVKYHKQIGNSGDAEVRIEKMKRFKGTSIADFRTKPLSGFSYFERIGYSDDYDKYNKAVGTLLHETVSGTKTVFLQSSFEPFEARNGQKLPWIVGSFLIGFFLWYLLIRFTPLKSPDAIAFAQHAVEKGESRKDILSILLPRPGYTITPIILYLNVLIFLAMVLSGIGFFTFQGSDLLAWGADWGPYTIGRHQYWRMLTSMFLHGGCLHLLMNMGALIYAGIFLEPVVNQRQYALAYLGAGILSSLTSLQIHPDILSVGASGAIFGLFGVMVALLLRGIFPSTLKKALFLNLFIFIGYNLLLGLSPGIDNAAHIGGLIGGVLIGLLIRISARSSTQTD